MRENESCVYMSKALETAKKHCGVLLGKQNAMRTFRVDQIASLV